MKTRPEIAGTQLQLKDSQELLAYHEKRGRSRKDSLLEISEGPWPCRRLGLLLLSSGTGEEYICITLSHSVCGASLQLPQETKASTKKSTKQWGRRNCPGITIGFKLKIMIYSRIRIILKCFKMTYIRGIHTALGERKLPCLSSRAWSLTGLSYNSKSIIYPAAAWPLASVLTSLHLSFLTCETERIIVVPPHLRIIRMI